jgi:hypothetical protein
VNGLRRLNVSIKNPDEEIQRKIDDLTVVGDPRESDPPTEVTELIDAINQLDETDIRILDLIAHARADGTLQLGNWQIVDGDPYFATVAAAIGAHSFHAIRLLGCYTADSEIGARTLRYIKRLFADKEVRVFGSYATLTAANFIGEGFIDPELLYEATQQRTLEPLQSLVARDFGRLAAAPAQPEPLLALREESRRQAEESMWLRYHNAWPFEEVRAPFPATLRELMAELDLQPREAPGLLTLPTREVLYPARGSMFHRVTALFGGHLIRVYPIARPGGVLLRPRGTALLA